ncbi:TonB-dependent receptor [Porticoccaceae bacterium LTM1]|nr:TonB-dependent receptor [Porticoccaceae bacterium LTM1]
MNHSKKAFRQNRLVLSIASAIAISASSSVYAANTETLKVDIEGQKAATSLMALARSAGVEILMSQDIGESIQLPALKGEFTLTSALEAILKNTNLTYEFVTDESVIVKFKPDNTDKDDLREVEEVVVTGSLLKKDNPAQPITVLTSDDIARLGAFSAEEIIRSLSQNYSSVNVASSLELFNPDAPGFYTPELQGNSTANLRGFGSDSTLVLVNGRRMAGAPVFEGSSVNLSNIPTSAIERVEILNDGASSIYGSDAVAGVINFILKQDYVGAETSVRYDNGENGGNRYSISQLIGTAWDSGRLNATLNYTETDAVSSAKAGYTTRDLRPQGGRFWGSTGYGTPGVVSTPSQYFNSAPWYIPGTRYGSLPSDNDGTNWTVDDLSLDNVSRDSRPSRKQLTSASKYYSVHVDVEQYLSDSVRGFADVTYSVNENINEQRNPFGTIEVPASNAFNKLDKFVEVGYEFDTEVANGLFPIEKPVNELESVNVNGGIEWNLPFGDWTLTTEAGYSTSSSDTSALQLNIYDNPEFDALVASSDPAVALNFFGNGEAQNPSISKFYGPDDRGKRTTRQHSAKINAEGGLYELPGGEARFAIGGEYRVSKISFGYGTGNEAVDKPEQEVRAVFTELSVPLVGPDNQLPAVKDLQMSFGFRWEENLFPQAEFGGRYTNTSPRVTLAWNPIDDLTIRTTWSESFRAPLLSQLLRPQELSAYPTRIDGDPFDPRDNPPTTFYVKSYKGGNPELKPQIADTMTLGFDWTPMSLEGLRVSVTYSKIEQNNRITVLTTSGDTPPEVLYSNNDFVNRNEFGVIESVNSFPINVAQRVSKSVDFSVDYEFDTDLGTFITGLSGTYTGELSDAITEGTEVIYTDRTVFGPDQWRARANLGWYVENMGADLFINYSNSYNNNVSSIFGGNSNELIGRVESYHTVDLSGFYHMDDIGLKISGGVKDLFHTPYPFADVRSGMPFDISRIDTRGRTIYLALKKEFQL